MVGIYNLCLKQLFIEYIGEKSLFKDGKWCYLCCNVANHVQKNLEGSVKRVHSVIQIIQLKGNPKNKDQDYNDTETISLQEHPYFQFSDIQVLKFWLQDLDTNDKIADGIKMHVLCSYSKL